jgi:hypothetical protein
VAAFLLIKMSDILAQLEERGSDLVAEDGNPERFRKFT